MLVLRYRQSPDGYTESTADSLADTKAFIKWVQQLGDDKIEAVVTPRFVPTCTPELLQGLGKLAADLNTPIQSHISESFDEVKKVLVSSSTRVQCICKTTVLTGHI